MLSSRLEKNKKQRKDIAKKKHIENTKNISKKITKIFLLILFIIGIIYIFCRYIGNLGLVVKEYSLEYDNLPDNFYGLKIIQISDVNFNDKTVDMNKIKKMVDKINSIRPDIIIFTGNLIYGNITQSEEKSLEEELTRLEATLGKYTVFGEDDDQAKIIIKNAGFKDIENNYDLIYKNDYSPILIVGFNGDAIDLDSAFAYFDSKDANFDIFTIAIMHKPDIIDEILNYREVNLALAGKSLNGQIRIPGIGGIFIGDGYEKYYEPYYKIDNTDFFISSGLGTRKLPYRLFNHPSINLYRLK